MSIGNIGRIDVNLLRVFDAIYAEQHVTRAAARLFTSQSAVSHSLQNLRKVFKDPLFIRTPEGMMPTGFADRIAAPIAAVLEDMRDILALRDEFTPATAHGKITVGLLSPTPPWLIPDLCRSVGLLAPNLSLAFQVIAPDQVVDALDSRVIQMGIGSHNPLTDRHRFVFESLFDDLLICAVDRDHPIEQAGFDLKTYSQLPHLVVATGHFSRTWIDDLLQEEGLERQVRVIIPGPHHIGDVLSSSEMVCTIMQSLILPDPRLRALAPPFTAEPIAIGQCTHSRDDRNPQIVWLREIVRKTCKAGLQANRVRKSGR
jgi:DNA-binding transcriptional LysR family regulator